MSWWLPHNFESKKQNLFLRAQMMHSIRDFFHAQDYVEVETPVLQVMPSADVHIHGFETELWGPDLKKARSLYLQTSPELDMKKLLVAGMERVFQICKVFRNGEDTKRHNPEFTMLEWYRTGGDYRDLMADCEGLVHFVCEAAGLSHIGECDPFAPWQRISVSEAFETMAGIDLMAYLEDCDGFRDAIAGQGIRVVDDDRWDDLFFRVMAEKIEPYLGFESPAILYDYPASMACLARKKAEEPRLAERFELFVGGVELANGFSELTDAAEQRRRFEADMQEKRDLYGFDYPLDEEFLQALEHGMPECCGIAMGLDRLAMLLSGAEDIERVLWCGKA